MKRVFPLFGLVALTACDPSETLTKYGGGDYAWRLVEVDRQPVNFPNEISFGAHGSVNGKGPCSQFSASQWAPYPWFEFKDVSGLRQETCAMTAQEDKYFADLAEMQIVEISGPNMVLSNEAGREMVFVGITDGG